MTTDEADRLLAAARLVGEHPEESRLLRAEIIDVMLFRSGTSATYQVTFQDDSRAAFKPIEGVEANAAGYGHTAASVILNDYAAWLVARGLGFESLVRGVVVTTSPAAGVGLGSMQTWLDGEPSAPGWEGASQLREAALFDAVIGQQDRNGTNFNYEPGSDELGLFDQSFSFALPGHQQGASEILNKVHGQGGARLDDVLSHALDTLENSGEWANVEHVLAPERFARTTERVRLVRDRGELLGGGEY